MISGRQRRAIFFTVLGICLVAAAVTLNVGWLLINWRESVLIVFGSIFFLLIIAGLVIFTIFLVREIRKNEQHDSFINAVTHELKTPVASIRLHLQTLQMRELDETKRRELPGHASRTATACCTIDRCRAPARPARSSGVLEDAPRSGPSRGECVELARTRFHLGATPEHVERTNGAVVGDPDELKAAVWNPSTTP